MEKNRLCVEKYHFDYQSESKEHSVTDKCSVVTIQKFENVD